MVTVTSPIAISLGYSGMLTRSTWVSRRSVRRPLRWSSRGRRNSLVWVLPRISTSPSPWLTRSTARWAGLSSGRIATMRCGFSFSPSRSSMGSTLLGSPTSTGDTNPASCARKAPSRIFSASAPAMTTRMGFDSSLARSAMRSKFFSAIAIHLFFHPFQHHPVPSGADSGPILPCSRPGYNGAEAFSLFFPVPLHR